jgi:hypothetical protein
MWPAGADRTIIECDCLCPAEDVGSREDLSRSVELFRRVDEQDFGAAERCRLAANSRAYATGGVLVPGEHHISLFHEWVTRHLDTHVVGSRRSMKLLPACCGVGRPGSPASTAPASPVAQPRWCPGVMPRTRSRTRDKEQR